MQQWRRWLPGLLLSLTGTLALTSCGDEPAAPDLAAPEATLQPQVLFGQPDGTRHPNVALLVAYDAERQPLFRCTGTLVDRDTILTAGHCVAPPNVASVRAYFGAEVSWNEVFFPTGGSVGRGIAHPLYAFVLPNTHDIGVVQLEQPVSGIKPATIAPEGTLDPLARRRGRQDTSFTLVGYGVQAVTPVPIERLERYIGHVKLVNMKNELTAGYNIQISSSPGKGTGSGGMCFGDSGGGVFYGPGEQIVAVNSFVLDETCRGAGFSYRTDIDTSQDFLAQYVDGITAD